MAQGLPDAGDQLDHFTYLEGRDYDRGKGGVSGGQLDAVLLVTLVEKVQARVTGEDRHHLPGEAGDGSVHEGYALCGTGGLQLQAGGDAVQGVHRHVAAGEELRSRWIRLRSARTSRADW